MMWETKSLNETSSFVWNRETLSLANRTPQYRRNSLMMRCSLNITSQSCSEVHKRGAGGAKHRRAENQIRFGDNWAIRPGAHIEGTGNNLNDVWIGG